MSDATPESAWVRARLAAAYDAAPTARAGALLAVTTGARIRDAAARAAVDATLAARAAGIGWDEAYEALFNQRIPFGDLSAGEAAFYYCTTGEPWPPGPSVTAPLSVLWTCVACLHRVVDPGPWDGPDGELGHTVDCPRHGAERVAWRLQARGDDEGAEVDE